MSVCYFSSSLLGPLRFSRFLDAIRFHVSLRHSDQRDRDGKGAEAASGHGNHGHARPFLLAVVAPLPHLRRHAIRLLYLRLRLHLSVPDIPQERL